MSETNQTGQGEPANNPNGETGQGQTQNNNTGQTQTTNNNGGGEHKNVSMDDFNSLSGRVDKILAALGNDGQNHKSNNNQQNNSGNGDDEGGDDGSTKFDITKDPSYIAMKAKVDAIDADKQHSSLMSVANAEAKKNGVSIKGFENNLIGKDTDSTKKLVQDFSKTVKAQTNNNTAGGFNPNASDSSHDDHIVDLMMENKFGPNFKESKK
ncbi:DUF4355 domain-containing protein [Apilactobacillus micheneri]|uniref:DUF4355 domain-containing protein n=1 Tax=Apilactobacillus micheneri TaxID=1899430 RepID=UPI000D031C6F|nr:DUF4355 domain-containing protein [Apilactobacillus micheneri]